LSDSLSAQRKSHIHFFGYHSIGSVSTLTKWIYVFFQKMNSYFNFKIIIYSIIYYNIAISVMKLFISVAYDKLWWFQHVNFIFSQNLVSLFWGLFNDETDLRVRYFAYETDVRARHFAYEILQWQF
jgi:hypothetical protein